ncbi:MAG: phosphate butyryltransferase [Candidatus Cloacimonetes bacterium 4572_65]|nr:MAG: phosphate butyryltransferase [Candidatus Cloacimonetes bacterium 4572_65]
MSITKLDQMFDALKSKEKKRLVGAYTVDGHSIGAISKAVDLGIIEATLVGDIDLIKATCEEEKIDINKFEIIDEKVDTVAASKAVAYINDGKGDLIMKGLLGTDKYMRALLNKKGGLMNKGAMLSHITVVEIPSYHKLLVVSDVAIIPLPELKQKVAITNNVIKTCKALDIDMPKISILASSETATEKIVANADAAIISKMAERGQIKGALVDGPLSLDLSIDQEAVEIKKFVSPVAGDADGIVFPNIESGNVFYKTVTKLVKAELAAVVCGANVPAILSSRGDTEITKLYSIALAALLA